MFLHTETQISWKEEEEEDDCRLVFTPSSHLVLWGALSHLEAIPVSADAAHAETVAAGRGRRVRKHIETDGAPELLIRQEAAIKRHPVGS